MAWITAVKAILLNHFMMLTHFEFGIFWNLRIIEVLQLCKQGQKWFLLNKMKQVQTRWNKSKQVRTSLYKLKQVQSSWISPQTVTNKFKHVKRSFKDFKQALTVSPTMMMTLITWKRKKRKKIIFIKVLRNHTLPRI